MADTTCGPLDYICSVKEGIGDIISKASNDALQQFVNNIFEGFGTALGSLGTAWARVPSPVVVVDRGGSSDGGGTPAGSGAFEMILSYVTWVGTGIAVMSLIAAGAMMISRRRHGDGEAHMGRIGVILIAVILLSSASALVAGFLPQAIRGSNASSVVGWVQQHLQWYTAGLAILSILVAAARMAWTQRATPLKELMGSILTLIAVAGAGLVVIRLATIAGDEFSISILNSVTICDVSASTGESNCFGTRLVEMMALTSTSPIGLIGLFLLGLLAILMTYVQIALMVFRGAMLVLLAGIFPLAASFTNTEVGRQWFKKVLAWTLAFLLYKPAAAIVYATAFRMTGVDVFKADGTGLFQVVTGLAMMLIALIALPALMKFLVPAVGSIGGGGSGILLGAAAIAGAGEVASGAIRASNGGGSSGSGGSSGGSSGGGGPSGSGATAAGSKGAMSVASGSGPAAVGSGSAATGAASSGAAAGGSAAAGGAAAGAGAAAAGPVGIGVAAAGKVADGAKQAAGAVQSQVADATGSNENGS